jgi:peptidyl-prolyl cis-trans isomerase C
MSALNLRLHRCAGALLCAALLTFAAPAGLRAQPRLGDGTVVARVGSRVITVADVERRIAGVPPFQLRTLGATPEEIRRTFVDRVMVREALLAEGAAAQGVADRDDVAERIRSRLRGAMLSALRIDVQTTMPVSDADIEVYYELNKGRFSAPPRVALWRILVGTREEAQAVLDDVKKDLTPKHWNEVCRDKSLDKATHMRGGNLGFVAPDGTTAEAGVKVDPVLVQAAMRVKDAELVPEPVREGERWAVVWRRQGMKAVERDLDGEKGNIRQTILHGRTEEKIKSVLEALRRDHLSEFSPELVDQLDITSNGELQPMRRPGSLSSSRRASAQPPQPVPGPGGLR